MQLLDTLRSLSTRWLAVSVLAAFTAVPAFALEAPSDGQAGSGFQTLDLTPFSVKRLDQALPSDCWSRVPHGLQTLDGVPFKMDVYLELTGLGTARADSKFFPTRIAGIPVARKAKRLYLLTGTGFNAPEGTPIAEVVLRYADSSQASLYIVYGVNTRDWWREPAEKTSAVSDPNSAVAWTSVEPPFNLRLYKTVFDNPYPERQIQAIDLVSLLSRATPVVVAISLQTNPSKPLLPAPSHPAYQDSDYVGKLKLRFVDEEGRPVTGALARFTLTDTNRTYGFGTNCADARGEMVLDYPAQQVLELRADVRAPDFVATTLSFTNAAPSNLPAERQFVLTPGVRIGGIVQDPSGKPIAGARVSVNRIVKDAVGQSLASEIDSCVTDPSGRWSSRSVAPGFKILTFKLTDEDFRPADYYAVDEVSDEEEEVSKSDLLAAKAVMVMKPGIAVRALVTDTGDKPIANADVCLRENNQGSDNSESSGLHFAKTDASGHFKLTLMAPCESILAVAAKGFSPQATNLPASEGPIAAAFRLEPAKPLKGRVLGLDNAPLAEATIRLVSWHGLSFPKWETRTDAQGRFTWDSAPADGADYLVSAPGYRAMVRQGLAPSKTEEVILLDQGGMIVGRVVDAQSKQPIDQFHVIIGRSFGTLDDIYWERYSPIQGTDGRFSFENQPNYGQEEIRLLVEAPGYLPELSPLEDASRAITCNFELKKGHGPQGVVRLPDGQPAEKVQVALLTGSYMVLKGRELQARDSRAGASALVRTDHDGRFSLPAAYATELVAVSPDGYAEAKLQRLDCVLNLTLQPWGRIEGVVKNGCEPATNQWVMVTPQTGGPSMQLQYDFDTYRSQADDQGRFEFKNVPPGKRFLVRLYQVQRGWSWSHIEPVEVKSGEATRVTYGGKGRRVIGKVVLSDADQKIDWQSGYHILGTIQPRPPSSVTPQELRAWYNSPEARQARANYRYYAAQFNDDGTFHIEDVPPGRYNLNFMFQETGSQNPTGGRFVGSIQREIDIPETTNGAVAQPLDLGELRLQVR